MKVLVCGSRNFSDYFKIYSVIKALGTDITIISGASRGADTLAVKVAQKLGLIFQEYPANWSVYGKKAGVLRNQQMIDLESLNLVVAFHPDINIARGLKICLKELDSTIFLQRLYLDEKNRLVYPVKDLEY